MNSRSAIVSLLLATALVTAQGGCGDDATNRTTSEPGPTTPLTLDESGGCADAYFWATTADDEHAVVVSVALRDRSTTEPTVLELTLPDPRVEVTLQAGEGLSTIPCTDLPQGQVDDEVAVTEGRVVVTVDPPGEVGTTNGSATLSGLVAADGTRIATTEVTTTAIGFYAG